MHSSLELIIFRRHLRYLFEEFLHQAVVMFAKVQLGDRISANALGFSQLLT